MLLLCILERGCSPCKLWHLLFVLLNSSLSDGRPRFLKNFPSSAALMVLQHWIQTQATSWVYDEPDSSALLHICWNASSSQLSGPRGECSIFCDITSWIWFSFVKILLMSLTYQRPSHVLFANRHYSRTWYLLEYYNFYKPSFGLTGRFWTYECRKKVKRFCHIPLWRGIRCLTSSGGPQTVPWVQDRDYKETTQTLASLI